MATTGKRAMRWLRVALVAALALACWPGAALAEDATTNATSMQTKLMQTFTVTISAGDHGTLDASTVTPQTLDDRTGNNQVSQPPTPQPSVGYAFEGWYDGNAKVSFPYTVAKDTTLTARYIETSGVVFDPNGGKHTGVLAPYGTGQATVHVTRGEVLPPDSYASPERDGYVFDYWSTGQDNADSAGDPFDLKNPIDQASMTLYARWSPRYYPIRYDESCYGTDGKLTSTGATGEKKTTEYRYLTGGEVHFTPVREGYEFKGWKVASGNAAVDATDASKVTISENAKGPVSLVAQWENEMGEIEFASGTQGSGPGSGTVVDIRLKKGDESNANTSLVTFYPRNGKAPAYRTVKTGSLMGDLPVSAGFVDGFANKAGRQFTFLGWSTDIDTWTGETSVKSDTVVEGDMDIYAIWDSASMDVYLMIPAYTGATMRAGTKDDKVVMPDLSSINGSQEKMHGYIVDGWYTDEALTQEWNTTTKPIPASRKLYAKCVKTVTLHANSGTVNATVKAGNTLPDAYAWQKLNTDTYQKTYVWGTGGLTLPLNIDAATFQMEVKRTNWKFMNWHKNATLTDAVDADTTGEKLVVVSSADVAAGYWAKWDPVVTLRFYQYGDAQGAYDNTIEVGASSTATMKLPAYADLTISDTTSGVGVENHRLFKWAFGKAITTGEAITGEVDSGARADMGEGTKAGLFDPGAEVALSDITTSTFTEPTTITMFAAWQAVIAAQLSVHEADFRAPTWLESVPTRQFVALESITLSSGTSRTLQLSAQNTTTEPDRDMFRQMFKAHPNGEASDEQLQATAFAFLSDEATADNSATFTYMGAAGAPGTTAAVGSIAPQGTYTGTLQMRLPDSLRTLRETEVLELPTLGEGVSDTPKAGFGTVKWTVGFTGTGGNAYLFGSNAGTSFD